MTVLHMPSDDDTARANITRYVEWLRTERGVTVGDYDELWRWSVSDVEAFWASIWDFFSIRGARPADGAVLAERRMPGARWFPGAELNYVDQVLRWPADRPAVVAVAEPGSRPAALLTYGELRRRVALVAAGLRRLGVGRGDRVAAYAPNVPETLIAFLATASLGAVWSACSPDFGPTAVLDRFSQIEPTVLVAADHYRFKGVEHDRRDVVAELARRLPSLKAVVTLDEFADFDDPSVTNLSVEPVPFDHPLWILYSSGTTGPPKAVVHGHGGILLEHLKVLSLHLDLGPHDRFFWFTSTGWMMWNLLVGGLLVGACVVLYDGSPSHPDLGVLWRMAEETETTYFGASAPYLQACAKAGVVPRDEADLSGVRAVGSTGAPLSAEGFEWVYANVGRDLVLGSVSGGTDLCTAFVGSCPTLPVHAGEIQCRCLGAKAEAFDESGRPVVDEVGELVLSEPMPSMPLYLWNDADGRRYRESYFATFPGVWRHGDWIRITRRGTCVISGRSDATLNRGGVRIGTAELYGVVEAMPEVVDSLVVDAGRLLLFVVVADGVALDDELRDAITAKLRHDLSPRHIPDDVVQVAAIPRTLNGKKLEVPVKRILLGEPPDRVVAPGALTNPESLQAFVALAPQG